MVPADGMIWRKREGITIPINDAGLGDNSYYAFIFLDLHNGSYVYESTLLRAYYIKIISWLYFCFSGFSSMDKKDVDNNKP